MEDSDFFCAQHFDTCFSKDIRHYFETENCISMKFLIPLDRLVKRQNQPAFQLFVTFGEIKVDQAKL